MPRMNTSQRIPFTLTPLLASGAPAQVQADTIVWATSDATTITVEPDSTGLAGYIVSVAPNTPDTGAFVSVTADADMGAGVISIVGSSDPADPFFVDQDPATQAASFTMTFAPAEAKA